MQFVLSKGNLQLDYATFELYGECFPMMLAVMAFESGVI